MKPGDPKCTACYAKQECRKADMYWARKGREDPEVTPTRPEGVCQAIRDRAREDKKMRDAVRPRPQKGLFGDGA
jgi:hypothetical protein